MSLSDRERAEGFRRYLITPISCLSTIVAFGSFYSGIVLNRLLVP